MSKQAWHKVMYVSVHMDFLDMTFDFMIVIMKCIGDTSCLYQARNIIATHTQ